MSPRIMFNSWDLKPWLFASASGSSQNLQILSSRST